MTPLQKLSTLLILVEKMRATQKNYFKHRTTTFLEQSKSLEKEVDQFISNENSKQEKLF